MPDMEGSESLQRSSLLGSPANSLSYWVDLSSQDLGSKIDKIVKEKGDFPYITESPYVYLVSYVALQMRNPWSEGPQTGLQPLVGVDIPLSIGRRQGDHRSIKSLGTIGFQWLDGNRKASKRDADVGTENFQLCTPQILQSSFGQINGRT